MLKMRSKKLSVSRRSKKLSRKSTKINSSRKISKINSRKISKINSRKISKRSSRKISKRSRRSSRKISKRSSSRYNMNSSDLLASLEEGYQGTDNDRNEFILRNTREYTDFTLMKPKNSDYSKFYVSKYTSAQKELLKTYLNRGYEINAGLRRGDRSNIKYINDFDNCFRKISELGVPGDILMTYRVMTNEFNKESNKGYISTSTIPVGIVSGILYEVYIPRDAEVCIFDISNVCKTINTSEDVPVIYEIVVKRDNDIIVNGNKMIISTKYIKDNPGILNSIIDNRF